MSARFILAWLLVALAAGAAQLRPTRSEAELRYWLANMRTHRYSAAEMSEVLGISPALVSNELNRLAVQPLRATNSLLVLPYPGGRHPRIGFLDGAIDPQRETKVSVFTPWDPASYVVVDVPEAIFSNLGLTYLAHTHVPTLWTQRKIELPPLEWTRRADGGLEFERVLPNQIAFGVKVTPGTNRMEMELWLRNGTTQPLSAMRVQNCVMLKAAADFNAQTNANKILKTPFAACGSPDRRRWIITAWQPTHRVWANPPVPCLHSDPQIPDCPPGETRRVRGWLWFYEGADVDSQLRVESLPKS